jgi:hypothetical protein
MLKTMRPTLALTTLLAMALAAPAHAARPGASVPASQEVAEVAERITSTRDNRGLPYAIVDKKLARVFVYNPDGSLRGQAPVLLGLASGDHTVPGIGERELRDIKPDERTTPAGRFLSEPGVNLQGEDIVWVDYDAAVSMHRVRPTDPKQRRLERLASATPADNRISYGCINVPKAFYEAHVQPLFGKARGVIYVLPETRPALSLFGGA